MPASSAGARSLPVAPGPSPTVRRLRRVRPCRPTRRPLPKYGHCQPHALALHSRPTRRPTSI
ncbi:hypothetical protein DKT68_05595 [Micromonospora acroterricola]|uniref:Uncharacterized protein n=1 Tax=Micromonospora acroterricola TaxID=2202421 RepID=A0A317D9F5_9ACTN|nr:hypothetical protein DKT68_05595 [Micromonospora acroterricola]